jgi:hypothetical protein
MMVACIGKGSRDKFHYGIVTRSGDVMERHHAWANSRKYTRAHLISRSTAARVHTFAPPLLWHCHDRGNRTLAPPLKAKEIVRAKFGPVVAKYVIENGPMVGRRCSEFRSV